MTGERRSKKNTLLLWGGGALGLILLAVAAIASFQHPKAITPPSGSTGSTRSIRDRAGRVVQIPDQPRRIASLYGASYEKLFAFGAADRIAMISGAQLPWCRQLNPKLKDIPQLGNYSAPDVEQLLSLKTDVVIYHPFAQQIQRMTTAGLPVVVSHDGSRRMTTLEDFLQDWFAEIQFYGELLGGDAPLTANAYEKWVNERLEPVIAVTGAIEESRRPKVFYFCGRIDGPSDTQTRFSTAYWLVEAAGGRMLTYDDASYFVSVSTEQLILWDPDIIVVSTLPSIEPVVENPQWQKISAVKNNRVYMSPQGLFYWSHFSTESYLCILFLAKHFHPDLFMDLDVQQELKAYYKQFYHYELTDDEARRILEHLPPETTS